MTPKTRIYLIRHGEVEGAATPRYNGQGDVTLTPRGREQYQEMSRRLAQEKITLQKAPTNIKIEVTTQKDHLKKIRDYLETI